MTGGGRCVSYLTVFVSDSFFVVQLLLMLSFEGSTLSTSVLELLTYYQKIACERLSLRQRGSSRIQRRREHLKMKNQI